MVNRKFLIAVTLTAVLLAIDGVNSLGATSRQQFNACIEDTDIYNFMFQMARSCHKLVKTIKNTKILQPVTDDVDFYKDSLPLLKELALETIVTSCQTLIAGANISKKVIMTEALNGDDGDKTQPKKM